MKSKIIYLLTLLALAAMGSCKKDEAQPASKKEIIMMEENQFLTKTALVGNRVYFSVKDKYQSYSWQIGNDPRVHTSSSFFLTFPKGSYVVTFAGKNGSSNDTITDILHVVTENEVGYVGKFAITYNGIKDTLVIDSIRDEYGYKDFIFSNLPPTRCAKKLDDALNDRFGGTWMDFINLYFECEKKVAQGNIQYNPVDSTIKGSYTYGKQIISDTLITFTGKKCE